MINQTSQFFAILTNVGVAKQANADALGVPWKITQMGVGDANDTDPVPNATQTKLINERRRAPLNQLKVDPANAAVIIAEQVIPAEVGGWWVREIGLYDADGDLVAIANCAPSFKPLLNQGSGRTQVVRINLQVSNASNVELKIDPSVVLATRAYVDQKVLDELNKLDFKFSVVAATTGSVVLNGLQTIDAVPGAEGQRVLVWKQVSAKENGIYLMSANAWTRAPDADTSLEVTPGLFVHVEKGDKYGDSVFQLVTDAPIVLGTTDLVFESPIGRTGIAAGTFRSVTVDKYGRVVGGTNPTTLAAYGITDAYTKAEVDAFIAQATETKQGTAKVSIQALVDAGADDTTIVTPKKLRWGFSILKASNGYIVFPSWLGGLIIQWGSLPIAGNNAANLTLLPIAWPNGFLQGVAAFAGAAGSGANVGIDGASGSKTQINLYQASPGGLNVRFVTVGH